MMKSMLNKLKKKSTRNEEEKQLTCIVIGGGQRGSNYALYSLDFPQKLKVVAICDPRETARNIFEKKYGLPSESLFSDWKEIAEKDKFVDFVCICTPDSTHKEIAVAFAKKNYHILLEKPMATSEEDCREIVEACKENDVILCVCHVLRYYPGNNKIKEIIQSGQIGQVVNIQHTEPVGFYHFAHSYVRGNWRDSKTSSFSLLTKSCHDIDLISYWMGDSVCTRISSFGSLQHFKAENKPEKAADRCMECSVEETCPYSAKKIYLYPAKQGGFGWPMSVVVGREDLMGDELVTQLHHQLSTGNYGKCVYSSDNNVCDNQIVNMEFDNGATATFTMIAFTKEICERKTKIYGTKGTLEFNGGYQVDQFDFLTRQTTTHQCSPNNKLQTRLFGHGGADFYCMDSFVKAIADNDRSLIKSTAEDTLKSHLLVFAAERSRLEGKTLSMSKDGHWT